MGKQVKKSASRSKSAGNKRAAPARKQIKKAVVAPVVATKAKQVKRTKTINDVVAEAQATVAPSSGKRSLPTRRPAGKAAVGKKVVAKGKAKGGKAKGGKKTGKK